MTKETKQEVFDALMADMSHGSEQWNDRYAAASPCNLPVIPAAVGDAITRAKADGMTIGDALWRCGEGGMFDDDKVESWICDHDAVFALAWLLNDWEVSDGTGD